MCVRHKAYRLYTSASLLQKGGIILEKYDRKVTNKIKKIFQQSFPLTKVLVCEHKEKQDKTFD
jgi:hypothetical protein